MLETTVPFLDVGATYQELRPALDAAYERVMRSGRFLLGEELEAFESEYAAFVGAAHAVGVASGLDALDECQCPPAGCIGSCQWNLTSRPTSSSQARSKLR